MGSIAPSLRRFAVVALLCGTGCATSRAPRTAQLPADSPGHATATANGSAIDSGKVSNVPMVMRSAHASRIEQVAYSEPQQRIPEADAAKTLPGDGLQEEAADRPREQMIKPLRSNDLSLDEAIRLTFEANPDLRSSWERTLIADELLANARSQFYPTLSVNQANQVSNNPLREFSNLLSQGVSDPAGLFPLQGPQSISHTQVHYQHDLYTGGLVSARNQAAESEVEASRFSLTALRNKMVFQVAEAYYRVFQARALVDVSRESVEQVESHLRAIRSRMKADTRVESDVLRVEVHLAEVREALSTATNSLELARAVLENVVGQRLDRRPLPEQLPVAPWSSHIDQIEAAVTAASQPFDDNSDNLQFAMETADQLRPEIGEIAHLAQAARHRVRAAQAGKYPVVGFVGDYDYYTGERTSNNSYFFGLMVSLNLFDGGRTRTNVRQAEVRVREVMARNERLKLDIELDVRRAALQLKDARERVKLTATGVTSAEANLRQMESRYRGQKATISELLDAQVLLSTTRVRSISAAADLEIARAGLERAVGRLSAFVDTCLPAAETPDA